MKRTRFYKSFTIDGVRELDFLYNSLSTFPMVYAPGYYRVVDSDIPDAGLISYKVYGTVDFWWILLLVNNIDNPFTELTPGLLLTIPHKLDIYSFQKKFKVQR